MSYDSIILSHMIYVIQPYITSFNLSSVVLNIAHEIYFNPFYLNVKQTAL